MSKKIIQITILFNILFFNLAYSKTSANHQSDWYSDFGFGTLNFIGTYERQSGISFAGVGANISAGYMFYDYIGLEGGFLFVTNMEKEAAQLFSIPLAARFVVPLGSKDSKTSLVLKLGAQVLIFRDAMDDDIFVDSSFAPFMGLGAVSSILKT